MSFLLAGNQLVFVGNGVGLPPVGSGGGAINLENTKTWQNVSGGTVTNYPFQLGLGLIEGEILDYPEVYIDGVPVLTQANVEQRWDDNSVKFATLFFHIPSVANNQTVTFTFGNQANGNTSGGLTAGDVLGGSWNFNATMDFVSGGVTKSVNGRTMLDAGHYSIYYSGVIATQFIICDHSVAATYDFGWGAFTEYRPIIHATFWPGSGQTRIRFIGELAKTTQLGSVTVDTITFKIGNTSPTTVLVESSTMTHNMASRWTRPLATAGYWMGGTPTEDYHMNHNAWYWGQTKLLPCWDTSIVMTEAAIAGKYSTYTGSNRTLYVGGTTKPANLFKIWDDGAGRDELGLYASQTIWQLLSGDKRLRELARGTSDIFAAFPVHYRESHFGRARAYQRNGSAEAGGRFLSINTRPTLFLWFGNNGNGITVAGDKFTIVDGSSQTSMSRQNYAPDNSHASDLHTINYWLTGDPWYWENCCFLAAYLCAFPSPANVYFGHRGPSGWYGGNAVDNEERDIAWPNRQRFHAWAITPERFTEEKEYFYTMSVDSITLYEGIRGISTPRSAEALYIWGTGWMDEKWPDAIPPPLRYHIVGGTFPGLVTSINWDETLRGTAVWMHNYLSIVFAEAVDLGLPAEYCKAWGAQLCNNRAIDGGIEPHSYAGYYEPTVDIAGGNLTTFIEVRERYADAYKAANFADIWSSQKSAVGHNYASIAAAATAMNYSEPNGPEAWAWFAANHRDAAGKTTLASNPGWAFIPRALV